VLILHARGTNRDHEAALAAELAGGAPEIVLMQQLLNGERNLLDYHMLVVPGGFSYGDDLGAGALWALDLQEQLGEPLRRFVAEGRPVLGICNGFQKLGFYQGWSGRRHKASALSHWHRMLRPNLNAAGSGWNPIPRAHRSSPRDWMLPFTARWRTAKGASLPAMPMSWPPCNATTWLPRG